MNTQGALRVKRGFVHYRAQPGARCFISMCDLFCTSSIGRILCGECFERSAFAKNRIEYERSVPRFSAMGHHVVLQDEPDRRLALSEGCSQKARVAVGVEYGECSTRDCLENFAEALTRVNNFFLVPEPTFGPLLIVGCEGEKRRVRSLGTEWGRLVRQMSLHLRGRVDSLERIGEAGGGGG